MADKAPEDEHKAGSVALPREEDKSTLWFSKPGQSAQSHCADDCLAAGANWDLSMKPLNRADIELLCMTLPVPQRIPRFQA